MNVQNIIELTKKLVEIPSSADNPGALKDAVTFVEKIVGKTPGVTIERFERNGKPGFLAYRGGARPEKFDILLNGHVDVVPAKADLFKPYEKDGRLYGRGTLDMKGTTLVLASIFKEMVNSVPYSLGFQVVSDEEVGGYDGTKLQIEQGVRSNFVIMGEYANKPNTIYNAARGLAWAEIAFRGKSAHGGHLWHGQNAVVQAGSFAAAVLNRYPTPDKETWTTTASIANLSTPNDTYNKVPDYAVLKIDFRFTQEDPVFRNEESIRNFIASLDPEAELLNLATFEPAVNVEELNPYVQGLNKALKNVSKKEPHFGSRPGGSDGRHFALVQNDIVEFGLYGHNPHSDHECVELSSFAEYRQTMLNFLREPIPAKLSKKNVKKSPLHEELLEKLVSMPTVSQDPKASHDALAFIEHFLTDRGMHIKHYERNKYRSIIATTKPGNKQPTVLLSAHIDVVPAPEENFKLTIKDGKYHGRGVMDMKHAIASYLSVVDVLKDELENFDFGIMITSDEEIGSSNGARPLIEEEGYRPKVVIIPDGGNNWQLETFAKGGSWIKLTTAGKKAHASRPWAGDHAVHRLLSAIKEIQALAPADPQPTDTFISVGTIEGGVAANQIPESASAILDIRSGSVEDHKRLIPEILEICKNHDVSTEVLASDPPCATDPKHPLVKPMIEIVKHITGIKHDTSYDYGMTDGRFFSKAGVPTIVINPECGGIHTDEEWISQKSLGQFREAIELYVRRIAAIQTPDTNTKDIQRDIKQLARRLNNANEPTHVWYANYGFGLSKEHFTTQIRGGRPKGTSFTYLGCADQTPPKQDVFMSLPYNLYFAGQSSIADGEGRGFIHVQPSLSGQTIARTYLITLDQLEEIVAQQNGRSIPQTLPLKEAMENGHAAIGGNSGLYDELIFCGTKDDLPIFAVTNSKSEMPHRPPSRFYTKLLCQGLSENSKFDDQTAIDYIMSAPGISGHYKKEEITNFFKRTPKSRKSSRKS